MKSRIWIRLSAIGLACALPLLIYVSAVCGRSLIWQGSVYASGDEVIGPVLANGTPYIIVAKNTWWYSYLPYNLAADAMYWTNDSSDNIFWGNHFPEPNGHSFLQIDEQDVDFGPFSNGDTGHTYTIGWNGSGSAVTFRIMDWLDGNYTNNVCHIDVFIYAGVTVGGQIADSPGQGLVYFAATGLVLACAVVLPLLRKACG